MLLMASVRKRSTSSLAFVRAMLSFERYVTAMIVKKTGTVRKMNDARMLGLSRRLFLKRNLMGQPSGNSRGYTLLTDRPVEAHEDRVAATMNRRGPQPQSTPPRQRRSLFLPRGPWVPPRPFPHMQSCAPLFPVLSGLRL